MLVNDIKVKELPDKNEIWSVAKKYDLNPVLSAIILQRGIKDDFDIKMFLTGERGYLHDPFEMKDMYKAVELLSEARQERKRVVIFGDYDVDGACSLAIVYTALKTLNFRVNWYLPDRKKDKYDLQKKHVDDIALMGCDLLITTDTGSNAVEAVEYAKKKGMKVLVTDHHSITTQSKPDALVNPQREDCSYLFKRLSGTGVAFKLVVAFLHKFALNPYAFTDSVIDLVTLATIADVMPLLDENRVLVKMGLETMVQKAHVGVQTLLREANLYKDITSTQLSFKVIPKLNSAGRMGRADLAYKLLIENDPLKALELYKEICDLNEERLALEDRAEREADEIIKEQGMTKDNVLVLYNPNWNNAICGNVSSKLNKKYNNLTVVFGKMEGEEEFVKGSARQKENINLLELVGKCEEFLEQYGGHKEAVGLTIRPENIDLFRKKINEAYGTIEKDEAFLCDISLKPEAIDINLCEELTKLMPYGACNEEPLFLTRNMRIAQARNMGKEAQHTKLTFQIDTNRFIEGVIWNQKDERLAPGVVVDVAYNLEINDFNFQKLPQMKIAALKIREEGN